MPVTVVKFLPALLALALAACQAAPTPRADGLILQDDFSDPQSGWDRHAASDLTTDYVDGQYQVAVAAADTEAWGLAGLDLNDMQIEVAAARAAGPLDNAYGVLCRFTRAGSLNNFYFFQISSDGYYAVGKVIKDAVTYLNPAGGFEPLAALQPDPAPNTLTATCRGDQLTFAVNGQAVGVFTDRDLTHGDIGLLAGTYTEGGVQILFDNVSVRQP